MRTLESGCCANRGARSPSTVPCRPRVPGSSPQGSRPQIPVGRLGHPDEVSALVAFLCTDDAAFITGANLAVNGGQPMQ